MKRKKLKKLVRKIASYQNIKLETKQREHLNRKSITIIEVHAENFFFLDAEKLEGNIMTDKQGSTNVGHVGQAAAIGPNAHVHDVSFQQIWSNMGLDLANLANELKQLRSAMNKERSGDLEHDEAIGVIAQAEKFAIAGDGPATIKALKSAGKWALQIAEKIGVAVAAKAIEKSIM